MSTNGLIGGGANTHNENEALIGEGGDQGVKYGIGAHGGDSRGGVGNLN